MQNNSDAEILHKSESDRLLAQIIESSDDAILGKTLDGIITSWNSAAVRIFGYSAREAVGQHISLLIPPDRLDEETEIIRQLKAGKNIAHYETVRRHKSGADIIVSLSVSPIRNNAGKIVGASKMARDITEKRQSEARLRTVEAELAHVARLSAMGQMSAAIAHELNQPLTAIVNYVRAAQRMLDPEGFTPQKLAGAREAMEKAAGQTMRAGTIIRQLREFVEKRDAERARQDLNLLVKESMALGFVGATDSNVKLTLNLSPAPLPVLVDRVQMQQVLLNLIRNGIEAMAASPRREMIITTAQEADGFAGVTIRDSGPGLPPEILAKLFQPFVTTKEKGMGIGLTICQSIVEAHGGTIQLQAEITDGASFHIRLPGAEMPA